jgi:hypothetical protein
MSQSFLEACRERTLPTRAAPSTYEEALKIAFAAFGESPSDYFPVPTGSAAAQALGPQDLIRQSMGTLSPLRLCTSRDERFAWSLVLDPRSTAAHAAILSLDLEPTARFWESVAE